MYSQRDGFVFLSDNVVLFVAVSCSQCFSEKSASVFFCNDKLIWCSLVTQEVIAQDLFSLFIALISILLVPRALA